MNILVCVLVAVVLVQGIVILGLKGKVDQLRQLRKEDKKVTRSIIKAAVKSVVEESSEKERYKDGYEDCYCAYKASFAEIKQRDLRIKDLKQMYDKIEASYNNVCANLLDLIRTNRVIKSKYRENIITLDFKELTKNDISELFSLQA